MNITIFMQGKGISGKFVPTLNEPIDISNTHTVSLLLIPESLGRPSRTTIGVCFGLVLVMFVTLLLPTAESMTSSAGYIA